MAGDISANDKFLSHVDAVLAPETGSLPRLIDAVGTLGNQTLQSMRLCKFQHLCPRTIGHDGERNMFSRFYNGRKYFTSFRERKPSQVTMFMNQNVKGVIDDVGLGRTKFL
jgi:hypothetical protein